MKQHDKLCKAAEQAIDDVFSDLSVSQQVTLLSLKDLRTNIDIKISCIETDLRHKNQAGDPPKGR